MGKNSSKRSKEDYNLASKAVYSQIKPKPYKDSINPYEEAVEPIRYARFKRHYEYIRNNWFWCEDVMDVMGGRPPSPVLKIEKIKKVNNDLEE